MAIVWMAGADSRGCVGLGDFGVSYVVSRVPRGQRIARGLVWAVRLGSISGQTDIGYAGSRADALAECERVESFFS